MLFINKEQVTTKEFIKAFGLEETLGLKEDEQFKINPDKPYEFEFLPEILQLDKFGVYGKVASAARSIPREYNTVDADGDSVDVRFSKMMPRSNPKTGNMEFGSQPKEFWRFSLFLENSKEDLFLFMLVNPECATSKNPHKENCYYRLRNRSAEIQASISRENKIDEAYSYIKTLTGQALVIKALGAKIEQAYSIYDNDGEAALRLEMRNLASKNPFIFMELITKDGGEVSGRIKYAIEKSIVQKRPTGAPGLDVWVFADGSEICRVSNTQEAYTSLQDTLVYSQELYGKLSRLIDKDISPEALAQLRKNVSDTSEKINALIDCELLTYDTKTKQAHWVIKGEMVEEPILKAKKAWKSELVEMFDKDKDLSDMLNEKYKEAKKKAIV